MKNLNYIQHEHLDYSADQLKLPLDLSIKIDKDDPLWMFLEIIEELTI